DVGRFVANVTYREPKQLFHNLGNCRFAEVTEGLGDLRKPCVTRGLAVGDYDNDGDLDILANNQNDAAQLLRNDDRSGHPWIAFHTVGTRSNRDGAHTKMFVRCGSRAFFSEVRSGSSYCAHSDRRVYFGLGSAQQVDEVILRWTSGQVERLKDLSADRILVVT